MSTVVKDLGAVSAYAYAVEKGYTGTEAEFAELMADYAEVGQRAEDAADSALESKTAAQTAATTATNKATEATTAATTATTKAGEASTSASTATSAKDTAVSASQTATSKATEATTAAATATSAKTDAVAANTAAQSAKTAAQTAQTGAETAAASVEASAAQIATNAADISQLKSEFTALESDGAVPSAEQILTDKGVTDSVPYHYRKTGGDGADRLYDQIVGGTVCFNQLANAIKNTYTSNGVTLTKTDRASGTITGTATANSNLQLSDSAISITKDHVYLIPVINGFTGTNTNKVTMSGLSLSGYNGGVLKSPQDYSRVYIRVDFYSGCVFDVTNYKHQLFDLTAMFGTEIADYIYQLEQTTVGAGVAFFKTLFPNDYYPYNAGELMSVSGLSEHKMTGFNVLDSNLLVSSNWLDVANGNILNNYSTRKTTVDYIKCHPNTSYYFGAFENGSLTLNDYAITLCFYDEQKQFISGIATANRQVIVSPQNAMYLRVGVSLLQYYICINLSDPAKNGTYEPYKAHSYPLDSSLTLRGIPKLDSNNKLYFDGDTYDADGTVTRRYGVVDLGTLSWAYNSTQGYFLSSSLDGAIVRPSSQTVLPNAICSRYEAKPWNIEQDKTFLVRPTPITGVSHLWIKDSSYTSSVDFKTALSGVMLVYELTTPTTEEADPYQHLQQCDPNGTEEYVSTGIVPVGHNSFYPENLRAKVEQLPWNFASLIAPTESAFVATRNYVTGDLFIVSNVLYKATSNIANGGTITPNTNCTATTLAEIISALA